MRDWSVFRLLRALVVGHACALYWYAIIKAVRLLTYVGLVSGAEWIARVTGLRARVLEALGIIEQ
jgi:hypothetical protein